MLSSALTKGVWGHGPPGIFWISGVLRSFAHGTGLEAAIFHTPMRVAPDVISQHFRTNLFHAILVPNKTIFTKREKEAMDKMYCRLK